MIKHPGTLTEKNLWLHLEGSGNDDEKSKAEGECKSIHHALYTRANREWPPDFNDHKRLTKLSMDGLSKREREVAFFVNEVFYFNREAEHSTEFIDISLSLSKIVEGCFVEDNCDPIKSPWSPSPPPMLKSTRLLVRYLYENDVVHARLASLSEIWQGAAWDLHDIADGGLKIRAGADKHDVGSKLVGMAPSVHHYCTLSIALIATSGKYLWYSAEEPAEEERVVASQVDASQGDDSLGSLASDDGPSGEE